MYAVLRHEIRVESGVARPVQRLLTSSLQGGAGQSQGVAESEGSQLTAELARAMLPILSRYTVSVLVVLAILRVTYSLDVQGHGCDRARGCPERYAAHGCGQLISSMVQPALLSSQVQAILSRL